MNEPIVFKHSVIIGQLVLIQLLVPALVAIGMLYGLTLMYEVRFDSEYRMLAVFVAILAPMVLRRPQVGELTILPRSWSISASLVLRWLLLLSVLFAIGYMTKTSTDYSRRVILTWALVTPLPLIIIGLAVHEFIRGFMHSPSNARRAVVAGHNDVSRTLASG